ncbi:hypothetical protein ACFRCX_30405 [Streptomyces sp. NPDC056652]|uniref:hypothetical protein n=1 Tax=Streptomyces sp. NPDC056652 TaxID=3345893 RepID=UPI0036CD89A6
MWASIIAVAGTLLGTITAHTIQTRTTDRRQHQQAGLAAAAALAGSLMAMRRLQDERWRLRTTGAPTADYHTAKAAALEARTLAAQHLFHVRALITDPQAIALANELVGVTFNLHDATDKPDLNDRHAHARHLNDAFAAAIGALIR